MSSTEISITMGAVLREHAYREKTLLDRCIRLASDLERALAENQRLTDEVIRWQSEAAELKSEVRESAEPSGD